MAGESSSANANVSSNLGIGKFEVNTYHIYYKTNNHLLDSGLRLIDTTANFGNEKLLIDSFNKLLPQNGINEKIYISTKLLPVNREGRFYSKDFEKLIINLRMRYLHINLIHYPAAPNNCARNQKNKLLPTESWLSVSQLRDKTKINAIGVYNFAVEHLIQLTEVVAIGPMVHQMRWYSFYTYSYGNFVQSNTVLKENPLIKSLAKRYNVSTAQILMLWTLQRGGVVIPSLTNATFAMENVQLNLRLSQTDLIFLDVLIVHLNDRITQ